MKKILHPKYLIVYTLGCGIIGILLRLWTLGSGPDSLGLYTPQPFAWTLLWLVSALCAALIALLVNPLKRPGQYHDHFSASLPGAVGNGFAAAGMILTGFRAYGEPSTIFSLVMSLLALAAALGLCLAAAARFRGNRQPFWAYLAACVFLALRLFDRCRGWSELPQTGTYVFPFLASACLLLASFHVTAFQVDLGSRRLSLFFSLASVYLCMICLASSEEPLFYLCMIVFLLTNLPTLRPLKKPQSAPAAQELPAKAVESHPSEMSYDELMDWLKNG